MAGDWIKIEHATPGKPEIDDMADALGVTPNEVLGALIRFWCWCDQQFEDGNAASVTLALAARRAELPDIGNALVSVGWLVPNDGRPGQYCVSNFDRHNGQTAKARGLTAKRVAKCKKRSANGEVTVGALPREEKRREEKKEAAGGGRQIEFDGQAFTVHPDALASLVEKFPHIDVEGEIAALGVWASESGKPVGPTPYAFIFRNLNKKHTEAAKSVPPKRNSPGPDLSAYIDPDAPRLGQ